jgi:hypothetical protein
VILAFLIIVLSIQTKLGIKVNILMDRLNDLWNGTTSDGEKKTKLRVKEQMSNHSPSQADFLDDSNIQNGIFPPAPIASKPPSNNTYDTMIRGGGGGGGMMDFGPMAANTVLGGSFGSSF